MDDEQLSDEEIGRMFAKADETIKFRNKMREWAKELDEVEAKKNKKRVSKNRVLLVLILVVTIAILYFLIFKTNL